MAQDPAALPDRMIDEVSDWFVTMRDPDVSTQKREEFVAWLSASPQHVRAYLEVAALWGEAAQLPREIEINLSDVAIEADNVVPLRAAHPVDPPRQSSRSGARIWAAASAAACVVAVLIGWLLLQSPVLSTQIAEQRLVTLEDGSTVRLNARSKVVVRLSASQREVELLEGQALFEVAKDSERPFIVRSDGVAVRAVGTAFDVNRRRQATVVTVVEGRVEVAVPAVDQRDLEMQGGQQATVDRGGDVDFNPSANVAAATSWMHNVLVFEETPLSIVIEELNRYSRKPILLEDSSLGSLRINAVLQSGNPDSLLRYLMRLDGVKVEVQPTQIRILRSQVPTFAGATLLPQER